MGEAFFTVKKRSGKSKARIGEINTVHGKVTTPAFITAGTKGTVKSLSPQDLKNIGTQFVFVNTYHLVTHPGISVIEKAGGIRNLSQFNLPLMSDSGGFQVFSLAQNKRQAKIHGEEEPLVIKISEDGVIFRSVYDGQKIEFTPEKSMEYQQKIGADIIMAFDECTYYPATHEYAEKAMERTHKWLKRCVKYHVKNRAIDSVPGFIPASAPNVRAVGIPFIRATYRADKYPQYLYGVIQGGIYEDLRKKSAQFISKQDVAGVAIGGVSVGENKKEMREQVAWIAPYLPADKPVHLLGVSGFDDILDLVVHGIDTFDCVEPTRMARMGVIYGSKKNNEIDITKSIYKSDLSKVDEDCDCYACQNFTKAYLYHLFKQRELLGYTLATIHNLTIMEKYFVLIRELIKNDQI